MGKPTMLGGAPFPQKTLADELRQTAEFYNANKYTKKFMILSMKLLFVQGHRQRLEKINL